MKDNNMKDNNRNLIFAAVVILSFIFGMCTHRYLSNFFKGNPITDEAARSYLFYMRTTKRLVEDGELEKLKVYVNEAYAIREHLFAGMSDPVAFEFFFKWENDEETAKDNGGRNW